MGFTWLHLNQVNVGTNVTAGHISYQWWCTLTRVSKCTTINTCTKHKKQYSKEKQESWLQGQEHLDNMALPPNVGGLLKHVKTRPLSQPKLMDLESVEVPAL